MFKWIQWLIANEFSHMRSFLYPLLDHESIPMEIRDRLDRRLKYGHRLMKIRILIYAIMFPAILGILAYMVVDALDVVLDGVVAEGIRLVLGIILQIVSVLFIFAGIGLVIVQRAILLCRIDAMVLAMEAVALGSSSGAPMPSTQHVKAKSRKD